VPAIFQPLIAKEIKAPSGSGIVIYSANIKIIYGETLTKVLIADEYQGHYIFNPWKGFYSTRLTLSLLDCRVQPESLGIVMDKNC